MSITLKQKRFWFYTAILFIFLAAHPAGKPGRDSALQIRHLGKLCLDPAYRLRQEVCLRLRRGLVKGGQSTAHRYASPGQARLQQRDIAVVRGLRQLIDQLLAPLGHIASALFLAR